MFTKVQNYVDILLVNSARPSLITKQKRNNSITTHRWIWVLVGSFF